MDEPGLGPIRDVTVATADLRGSSAAYSEVLGFQVLERGVIVPELARAWQAPECAHAPFVTVGPASGVGGAVRLVEDPAESSCRPATTLGWAALEISVPDVDAIAARLPGTGFEVLVPPASLAGLANPVLRAMQLVGPSGELIYLTQIMGSLPNFDLPQSSGEIDGVFVAVLATSRLDVTRTWFEHRFGLPRASDRMVAIEVLNRAFDLPRDTQHRISSLRLAGSNVLEHDQYPATALAQDVPAGHLPRGVGVVTLAAAPAHVRNGLDHPVEVLHGPDGIIVELVSR